jgi:hypothetical protein
MLKPIILVLRVSLKRDPKRMPLGRLEELPQLILWQLLVELLLLTQENHHGTLIQLLLDTIIETK